MTVIPDTVDAVALPAGPGSYGVTVFRGPSFTTSGYGDNQCGQDGLGYGTVVAPSTADLAVFARSVLVHGHCGSWSPWRTQKVIWASPH
eukprot:4399086-Pyramimonas_sp.AAC.1